MRTKNYLTTIILLSITFGCLVYIHGAKEKDISSDSQIKLSGFPLEIGQWQGVDIPLSKRTYAILGTNEVIMRKYANPKGELIGLTIVLTGSDRSTFHPPEICYIGAGVELLRKTVDVIDIENFRPIKVNKLIMKDKAGLQAAWYWFFAGNDFTHNYYLQQCRFILNNILRRGGGNYGALIRVSARTTKKGLPQTETRVKRFIGKATILLSNYLKNL